MTLCRSSEFFLTMGSQFQLFLLLAVLAFVYVDCNYEGMMLFKFVLVEFEP